MVAALAAVSFARPRYLVIPLEGAPFKGGQSGLFTAPMLGQLPELRIRNLARQARAAILPTPMAFGPAPADTIPQLRILAPVRTHTRITPLQARQARAAQDEDSYQSGQNGQEYRGPRDNLPANR